MKRLFITISLLLVFAHSLAWAEGNRRKKTPVNNHPVSVDTILGHVMRLSPYYNSCIEEYHADVYVKGRVYVAKRNHLIRFMPDMFRVKKGVDEYLFESLSDMHFTAPNIYDKKVKSMYGTVYRMGGVAGDVLEYFHVSIYSHFLMNDKLLSPIIPQAKQYYTYELDSVRNDNGCISYKIKFKPRSKNYQLVTGYVVISDSTWTVREMRFAGRSEYLRFDNLVYMGEPGTDSELLPVKYDFDSRFKFMGCVVEGEYSAVLNYRSIELADDDEIFAFRKKKNKYDLTASYNLQTDTARFKIDSLKVAQHRPVPLTEAEQHIYDTFYVATKNDTIPIKRMAKSQFWGQLGDMLVSDYTLNFSKVGSIRGSALINPFLMTYSGTNGLSYKQVFKYNQLFTGDRLLRVAPRIGYNFKHKEFYWRVNADYEYWPRKRSSIHLEIGNGNRIYNSEVLDEIKAAADSTFNFDLLDLVYFRDFYYDLRHRIEITNGLQIDLGISVHKRKAVHDDRVVDPGEGLLDIYRRRYRTFAPRIVLRWTPGQYYYMNGLRKVNLHSRFPTITFDWERGLKGVFNSTGGHERFELDLQHQIPIDVLRTLYYRVGGGYFTDQDQVYFVDFAYFARNNLPTGWNDEIGGAFQLLDRRWYNSSRKYLRANVAYEAPIFLIPSFFKHTHFVMNERLYGGVVIMPHLNPYIEVGYGIGTHIFDLGVFAGFNNGQFEKVGFRFTFELFNK